MVHIGESDRALTLWRKKSASMWIAIPACTCSRIRSLDGSFESPVSYRNRPLAISSVHRPTVRNKIISLINLRHIRTKSRLRTKKLYITYFQHDVHSREHQSVIHAQTKSSIAVDEEIFVFRLPAARIVVQSLFESTTVVREPFEKNEFHEN